MITANETREQFKAELYDRTSRLTAVRWFMVDLAHELIGAPGMKYTSREKGMCPTDGMDCSGFICHLVARANEACETDLQPPRHANAQFREFGETVDYTRRAPGDLVYFPSRFINGLRIIGHVGLVVAREAYIHSPGKDDTTIELAELPEAPEPLSDVGPDDIYAHTPAGIKRLTLPIGDGRWHAH